MLHIHTVQYKQYLSHQIDRQIWFDFVNDLNQIYAEADKLTPRAYFENILGLLTCHLSRLCLKSQWTIKLEEVKALIDDANQQHFVKNGLYVCNPVEKGFRVVSLLKIFLFNYFTHRSKSFCSKNLFQLRWRWKSRRRRIYRRLLLQLCSLGDRCMAVNITCLA
jgi:hypothetical protein